MVRNVSVTQHFSNRVAYRLKISPFQAGKDVIRAINKGNVFYSKIRQSYKIVGYHGVYILTTRLTFITAYRNNRRNASDRNGFSWGLAKGSRLTKLKKYFNNK